MSESDEARSLSLKMKVIGPKFEMFLRLEATIRQRRPVSKMSKIEAKFRTF